MGLRVNSRGPGGSLASRTVTAWVPVIPAPRQVGSFPPPSSEFWPSSKPFIVLLYPPPLPPRPHRPGWGKVSPRGGSGTCDSTRWEAPGQRLAEVGLVWALRGTCPQGQMKVLGRKGRDEAVSVRTADTKQRQGEGGWALAESLLPGSWSLEGSLSVGWGGGHLHSFCSWKSSALTPGSPPQAPVPPAPGSPSPPSQVPAPPTPGSPSQAPAPPTPDSPSQAPEPPTPGSPPQAPAPPTPVPPTPGIPVPAPAPPTPASPTPGVPVPGPCARGGGGAVSLHLNPYSTQQAASRGGGSGLSLHQQNTPACQCLSRKSSHKTPNSSNS